MGEVSSMAMGAFMKKINVLANNLSNSQTTGFKRSKVDFQDYIVSYSKEASASGGGSTTGLSNGSGVKISGTTMQTKQGSMKQTGNQFDWAINGPGFFRLIDPISGQAAYSRNGKFKMDEQGRLVNSNGYVLDPTIQLQATQELSHVSSDGRIWVREPGTGILTNLAQLNLTTFPNPSGLKSNGGSLYIETSASGAPISGPPNQNGTGSLVSGSLEGSNVQIVHEMVDLVTTQKAFDTNHKVIMIEDKMASLGDILKR